MYKQILASKDLLDVVNSPLAQQADFDFQGLAIILAGISFGIIGAIMAGSAFWPELAERYKKNIPTVIVGVILVGIAGVLVDALGG